MSSEAKNYDNHLNTKTGVIAWFARNPVAANLLMIAIILAGINSALTIRKQMFPMVESNRLSVTAVYPGASPAEVEETITTKLEEALQSVEGIEKLVTRSNRGYASASLEVMESYDPLLVLDEVKSAVDAVSSFPVGMEPLRVNYNKFRQEVMWLNIYGDVPIRELKRLGETIHDELRALPGVNITEFYSGADYEIAIEVSQDKLREYRLGFNDIANAVRGFSTNRSAGEIRADSGYISVRVDEQAYIGEDFENIPLRTLADGTKLYLRDVATVNDGFVEGVHYSKMNGVNSLTFFVGASRDQDITDIADTVKNYLAEREATLPEGIYLSSWADLTYYLKGRLNMMLENMLWGGILVFLILSMFLRMKLAFWVMMGLPVSFLGALALLPLDSIDITINVLSLFAFIMVLGVVVDDAIIIGESVYTETQSRGLSMDNVIRGAQRVAVPATFGVLTTMAAFVPMVFEDGAQAAIANSIGSVVVLCLLFSLVESKLILPAHLAAMPIENKSSQHFLARFRRGVDENLAKFIYNKYTPFLERIIRYRYTVLAGFIALIILTAGMFASGVIKFIPMPKVPHDFSKIILEMNPDSPESALLEGMMKINDSIRRADEKIKQEFGKPMVDRVLMYDEGRTRATIDSKLVEPEDRPVDGFEFSRRLRMELPEIANMKNITIIDTIFHGGTQDGDLNFRIAGQNAEYLRAAAEQIKAEMRAMKGVSDVNDSEQAAAQEIQFKLKPVAYSLGLTTADVASQASFSLYGIEAQRIMRDRQEIRVMVRYPKDERNTLASINDVLIRTPGGGEVLLSEVANIEFTTGENQIYREDGNRAISVWASVDSEQAKSFAIADTLEQDLFPELLRRYPGISIEEAGKLKDDRDSVVSQMLNIAMLMLPIYVLLALPLKSYAQPLMIMSVIPFGIIGAILGHLLLGKDMSMPSIFGLYAVVGVVVNDSLVMVDYVNRAREHGEDLLSAVLHAGQKRFRAIVLTSLTTFIGLVPILLESSLQAKIVIPMAISLGFGVLFATLVTLILVPNLYVISADIGRIFRRMWLGLKNILMPAQTT